MVTYMREVARSGVCDKKLLDSGGILKNRVKMMY